MQSKLLHVNSENPVDNRQCSKTPLRFFLPHYVLLLLLLLLLLDFVTNSTCSSTRAAPERYMQGVGVQGDQGTCPHWGPGAKRRRKAPILPHP